MTEYLYLHGFASSPQSTKAQYLRDRFQEKNLSLPILDFNQGDFSHLTLSRQIQQAIAAFPNPQIPITLIGSSFGGLTAAWLAEKSPQVAKIICLAPAFHFLENWLPTVPTEKLQQWKNDGYSPVYHYGEKREIPLHYHFIEDLKQYSDQNLQKPVPTLILHGSQDNVIPILSSRHYCQTRPWTQLIEFESDHTLANVLPNIWQAIQNFCNLS